jgi:ATP-binding cassette subfamily B protein
MFKLLWKNVFVHCKVLFLLVVISCSVYAFSLAPIWIQKGYIDRLQGFLTGNYALVNLVWWLVFFYLVRCLSGGFLIPVAQAKDLYYEYILTRNVRRSQHCMNNNIRLEYYDSMKMYNLMERVGNVMTSGALRDTVNAFAAFLTLTISLVAILISLGVLHYGFVILACISIIPIFVEYYWFQKKIYELDRKVIEDRRRQQQCIAHIRDRTYCFETRISGAAPYFQQQWENYRNQIENLQNKIYLKKILFGIFSGLIKSISIIGIIILATYLLAINYISIGSFCAVLGIIGMLFSYMDFFISTLSQSIIRFSELKDISEYYELEQEEKEEQEKLPTVIGDIVLNNVSFRYESRQKDAIQNVTKTFKKGEKIAILGVNGAGKTTLMNIVMGLYQPTNGSVSYNGVEIRGRDKTKWHEKIAAVFQDYQIYALTISENVMLGNVRYGNIPDKVIAALERAEFPYKKWEQNVDSLILREFGGIELSKGETQKLAIARSYYNTEAEILVIDEPTAALDPISEENLYKTFMKETSNKTTFIVSHRLGSVKIADRILVMDASNILEDGSHKELLKQNGLYAQMYKQQATLYER